MGSTWCHGKALDQRPLDLSPRWGSNMPTWPEMWHETCGLSSSPDSAAEEHRLLGNDGEFAPEVSKADITDSHSVDLDTASR